MTFHETVTFLEQLARGRIAPRLNTMQHMTAQHGNAYAAYPTVHIVGTNGKGSTAAILEACFRADGYRTGLYTSPHIHSLTERIQVNGEHIAEKMLIELVLEYRAMFLEVQCTYFEAVTFLAFEWFRRNHIEVGIIEAGLGGTWDATNIVQPQVTVITELAVDHQRYLGDSLQSVMADKAGAIKNNVPCIVGTDQLECLQALQKYASDVQAPMYAVKNESQIVIQTSEITGTTFSYHGPKWNFSKLTIPLPGDFQVFNAALAIRTLEVLQTSSIPVSAHAVQTGCGLTHVEGRFELISTDPPLLVDVAHNPAAIQTLVNNVARYFPEKKVLTIFGVMKDKDYQKMLSILAPVCVECIVLNVQYPRAAACQNVVQVAQDIGIPAIDFEEVHTAFAYVTSRLAQNRIIVGTGSFLTVALLKNFKNSLDN